MGGRSSQAEGERACHGHPGHLFHTHGHQHRRSALSFEERRSPFQYHVGQKLDAKDSVNQWYPASVVQMTSSRVLVHYQGWASKSVPSTSPSVWPNTNLFFASLGGTNGWTTILPGWRASGTIADRPKGVCRCACGASLVA